MLPCECVCVSPGFPPPATELDLNSGAERGDREGEEEKEKKEVNSSGTEEKKTNKQATCSDKAKKEKSLWLPLWCNVW